MRSIQNETPDEINKFSGMEVFKKFQNADQVNWPLGFHNSINPHK